MKPLPMAGRGRRRFRVVARFALGVGILALSGSPLTHASETANSPTCGPVNGKSKKDLANVLSFCKKGVSKGAAAGAYAMESLLWIKVPKDFAQALLADRLQAEQLVKIWMKAWKQESGSKAVTVYVEWKDVEIAKGETTLFSGDKVTIKQ